MANIIKGDNLYEGDLVFTTKNRTPLYLADRNGKYDFPSAGPIEYLKSGILVGRIKGIVHTEYVGESFDNYELVFDESPNRKRYVWVNRTDIRLYDPEADQIGAETTAKGITTSGANGSPSWFSQYGTLLVASGAMVLILIIVLLMKRD